MPSQDSFDISLRGYDRAQVDRFVETVTAAWAATEPVRRAELGKLLADARFSVVLRGYDRAQVDQFAARARAELA